MSINLYLKSVSNRGKLVFENSESAARISSIAVDFGAVQIVEVALNCLERSEFELSKTDNEGFADISEIIQNCNYAGAAHGLAVCLEEPKQ